MQDTHAPVHVKVIYEFISGVAWKYIFSIKTYLVVCKLLMKLKKPEKLFYYINVKFLSNERNKPWWKKYLNL